MYIAIDEHELDALRGTDYSLTALYIYLKQYMDFDTSIVGYKRRISYQGMSEALYIEPRQGVKGGSPHISSIRRMLDQLIKCGLITKTRKDTLVFKLPMVDTSFYVINKPDRKSTPIADTDEAIQDKALQQKADRPKKAKADIPHYTLNPISKASSPNVESVLQEVCQKTDDDDKLHFHKSLHTETIQQMEKMLKGFQTEQQQELLDELSWYISKKKISATPTGLLIAMIKQAKAGAFFAANAHAVKKARENPPAIEKPKAEPTAEAKAINKEKGRAAMGNVMSMFKKGVAA